jgi:hypothetical protein
MFTPSSMETCATEALSARLALESDQQSQRSLGWFSHDGRGIGEYLGAERDLFDSDATGLPKPKALDTVVPRASILGT